MRRWRQVDTTSIIVTTYDRADLVGRATESALAQAGVHEVVVVDDGSTDDTSAVLARFEDRIRVVRQANAGLSAARNAGAENATGTWIGFLDDDDRLLAGWLSHLGDAATHSAPTAIACCAARYVDTTGSEIRIARPRPLGPAFGDRTALFLAGSFVVRRSAFIDIGGYAQGLRCSHQTELGLRLAQYLDENDLDVACVDEPLVEITVRAPSARPMSSPEALYEGSIMVLDRHRDRLGLDPRWLADFYSVAGVSAARLGRYSEARRLLLHAARSNPGEARRWARLALAAFPPIGDRVWRSGEFQGLAA